MKLDWSMNPINKILSEDFKDCEGEAIQELYFLLLDFKISDNCDFSEDGRKIPTTEDVYRMKEDIIKYFKNRAIRNKEL